MAETVVTLSWEDHTSGLATEFKSLLDNNSFVDCTISAEGQSLKAHRLVLSACSPYFHKIAHVDGNTDLVDTHSPVSCKGNGALRKLRPKSVITPSQKQGNPQGFLYLKVQPCLYAGISGARNQLQVKSNETLSSNFISGGTVSVNGQVFKISGAGRVPPVRLQATQRRSAVRLQSGGSQQSTMLQLHEEPVQDAVAPTTRKSVFMCVHRVGNFIMAESVLSVCWKDHTSELATVYKSLLENNFLVDCTISAEDYNETSHGNTRPSELPSSQQQLMQLGDQMSSGQDVDEESESSLPVILVPKSEQLTDEENEEPMDYPDEFGNAMNERVEETGPASAEHNLNQRSSADALPPVDYLATPQQSGVRLWSCGAQEITTPLPHSELQLPEGQSEEQVLSAKGGKALTSSSSLSSHSLTHTREPQLSCDVCGASFSCPSHLIIHNRTHTGERPYRCDVCGSCFITVQNLSRHKRMHAGERPYICDVCGKTFMEKKDLIYHRRTHTGERPYSCDLCGKTFIQNKDLTTHLRAHSGERPYRCDVCGRAFILAHHLSRHKRTHTGERPYPCDVCGFAFARSSTLADHKRMHTGERPFICGICGKKFRNASGAVGPPENDLATPLWSRQSQEGERLPKQSELQLHGHPGEAPGSSECNSSMAESVVTVSWEDHTSELVTEFKSLLENNTFVDCTISAEGQSLQAHRLVLSACSPYFHRLFCEETEDHPLVMLLDESFQNLKAVIDFIYCGVTQIPEGNYRAFVTLAKSLEVKGLTEVSNNLPGSTTDNDPQDPSAKNQVTGEVQGISASLRDSCENKTEKIAHHLDGNTDRVDTHSPVSCKGNSALGEVRLKSMMTPSQEQEKPQDPSVKNQVTDEVPSINASSQKDSSENNSQKIAHHSDGNTDLVDTHSPVSVKGNSALRKLRPKSAMNPSQEQGTPQGVVYLQVQPYLYAPILGAKNQLLVKSNESLSNNFTSQVSGGAASLQGQVFLISGAGSLPPVGLQAAQQLSGGPQQNVTLLPQSVLQLCEEPVQDAVAPTTSSTPAGHKRKQKKKHVCKVCGGSFVSQCELDIHNRTHTGERPYLCDVCGATFARQSQLASHSTIHTGERPYECDFCGKTFRQKSNLNLHLPLHTGKRPHRCDVCGKTFLQKQEFTEHKNLHTGERPHRCDLCGIAFRRAHNLRIHKYRHTGEWPFRCDVCGKTFAQKSRLTQHMPAHTGERRYNCDVCGKSFGFQQSLAIHRQIHTGVRPHRCDVCDKTFRLKTSLVAHGNSSMAESVATVSWIDHTSELATEFKSFLDNSSFVDCTISAEGQSLQAHRLVLSACSPYFHKLFCEETEDHPLVILLDESFQNLKAVIEFMYLGVTQIPEANYRAFVTLAKSLEVKGLSQLSSNPPASTTAPKDPSVKNQVTGEVKGSNATQNVSSENEKSLEGKGPSQNNPPARTTVPKDPSVKNQVTGEVKGSNATQKVSSENEKSLEGKGPSQNNPPASTTAPKDPSVKNQVTGEVKGSNATQKVSSENKNSQKIAQHLNGNTDPVDTHSPVSFKGNSALCELRPKSAMKRKSVDTHSPASFKGNSAFRELRPKSVKNTKSVIWPSQGQESPQGALYLQVQPGLYTAISGASNQLLVKSNESLPKTFTSQMGIGTAPSQGQVFLISGASSLPPVGLQATQQLSGALQNNTTLLLHKGPILSTMVPTPTSNLAGHKPKQKKKLTCKVCGVSCNAQANLTIHERTHTGERPYLCDVCGATFSTSGILTSHLRTHTGERPYECNFCGKTFRQKSHLNLHMPLHTGKYPHRCDVCGKTFLQNKEFTEHKNLHTGERPNRCDICGIGFRLAQNLRVHKLRHTGEWPFHCDVCGKTFPRKSRLTQHMPVHTGERSYKCDVCGKSFSFSRSLDLHRQIHTGVRPHRCELCGKAFVQKSSLVAHSRVHTGERPFSCDLCESRFHQRGGLAYHMRTHNKNRSS
ncbi:Protein suppressor of hairy wing [Gryllus bimaculatus]|nr:Protein suppressor of hairy wing [Gryllus bimaculatus]